MKFKDFKDTKKGYWKWGCAMVLLYPVAVVVEALTVRLFWGWFVQPLGVRAISTAHALAFGAFVAVYFPVSRALEKKPDDEVLDPETLLIRYVSKWAVLPLFGWLTHLAMTRGW